MAYTVPAGEGRSEYTEKRSSFLGAVARAETEEEARVFIAQIKKQHRDARHNCWCYIIKDGPERYSDDGEPQGTAGIPMLEVFRKSGVTNAVCVVTRYFGGVLLGAGGLLRAYTKAAKDALEAAGREEIVPRTFFLARCPYALADSVRRDAEAFGARTESTDYAELVTLCFSLPEELAEGLPPRIFDLTGGRVLPEKFIP